MSILSRLRDKNNAYDVCEKELLKMYSDGKDYIVIVAKLHKILNDLEMDYLDKISVLDKIASKYNTLKREN